MIPEFWVVFNLLLSIIGKMLIVNTRNIMIANIFIFTATFRIFAMFIYQVNVLFFDRYEQRFLYLPKDNYEDKYVIQSGTRMIILLLINMVEYIVHFSTIYVGLSCILGLEMTNISISDSIMFFFNINSLPEFANNKILFYIYCEIGIGMFMNILCIARMLNLLPNTNTVEK